MYLRIDNLDLPVNSASIKWTQNAPADINVTLPAALVDWQNCRFKDIEIWKGGTQVISGFVFDSPSLSFDANRNVQVTLGCVDNIGRLMRERAKSNAFYQNSQITSIIQSLLAATSDWILGSTSTMVDPLAVTTIDLRSKEHIWAQIVAVTEATPQLFLRYGGYNVGLGKHQLDIGNFNTETSRFIQGHNITSIQLQKSTEMPYTVVEAYGGKLSNRKVNLLDALSYPTILSHSDYATYPIQFDAVRGTYIVRDLTPGKLGNQITKTFNSNKTKNDSLPTSAQIAEAGFGLWRNAVRFLQQSALYQIFTVSGNLSSVPQVSDRAWLQGSVTEPIYDPLIDNFTWHDTFSVANSFRVTRVELNFEKSSRRLDPLSETWEDVEEYTVDISDNNYVEPLDDSVELYDKLEQTDSSDDIAAQLGILNQQFVVVTHTTAAPADLICNPGNWKEFIFSFVVPPGAASIFYNILPIEAAGVTFKITQVPTVGGAPLKLCVQQAATWPGTTPVTIRVQYTFN